MPVPGPTALRHRNILLAKKILNSVASAGFTSLTSLASQASNVPLKHDLSPEPASIGPHVDQMVGSPHNLLVMLHHHHRIA